MTVTSQAVFTFGEVKTDYKRPYARLYYEATVFNRANNKTTTIEIPFYLYENIAEFLEECLYSVDSIDKQCSERNLFKSVDLLNQRGFYQQQAYKLKSINLDIDSIWSELIFGRSTNEQD